MLNLKLFGECLFKLFVWNSSENFLDVSSLFVFFFTREDP
jgi:hypothetical protein